MTPIEQLKSSMREAFCLQKSILPEGQRMFFGGSPARGGYVDIPVGFMEGVDPEEAYHPEYYWAKDYNISFDELLKIANVICDEVKNNEGIIGAE